MGLQKLKLNINQNFNKIDVFYNYIDKNNNILSYKFISSIENQYNKNILKNNNSFFDNNYYSCLNTIYDADFPMLKTNKLVEETKYLNYYRENLIAELSNKYKMKKNNKKHNSDYKDELFDLFGIINSNEDTIDKNLSKNLYEQKLENYRKSKKIQEKSKYQIAYKVIKNILDCDYVYNKLNYDDSVFLRKFLSNQNDHDFLLQFDYLNKKKRGIIYSVQKLKYYCNKYMIFDQNKIINILLMFLLGSNFENKSDEEESVKQICCDKDLFKKYIKTKTQGNKNKNTKIIISFERKKYEFYLFVKNYKNENKK